MDQEAKGGGVLRLALNWMECDTEAKRSPAPSVGQTPIQPIRLLETGAGDGAGLLLKCGGGE